MKGKYVGETEKLIKKKYSQLNEYANTFNNPVAKSLLFIDEVEAIAGDRSTDKTGLVGNAVTALLQTMDGFSTNNVITIAATNLPFDLDSAVLRRFTTRIFVDLPGLKDRFRLIRNLIRSRLSVHSASYNIFIQKKTPTNEEQKFITKEDSLIKKDITSYETNIGMYIIQVQLAVAFGWTDKARQRLIDRFKIELSNTADEPPLIIGKIENFISKANHESIFEKIKPSFTNLASDEPKIHKLLNKKSKNGKIQRTFDFTENDLYRPRFIFGYSPADITTIIKKILNTFAITTIRKLSISDSNTGSKCRFICESNANDCVICPHPDDVRIDFNYYINADKKKISPAFLNTIREVMDNTRSSIRPDEYSKLVFYYVTAQNPKK